jgi:hypothetical protein
MPSVQLAAGATMRAFPVGIFLLSNAATRLSLAIPKSRLELRNSSPSFGSSIPGAEALAAPADARCWTRRSGRGRDFNEYLAGLLNADAAYFERVWKMTSTWRVSRDHFFRRKEEQLSR